MRLNRYPLLVLSSIILLFSSFSTSFGQDRFSKKKYIAPSLGRITSVCVGDLDGDNDEDIVCISKSSREIVWHQNISNTGDFLPPIVIYGNFYAAALADKTVLCEDIDNDGDLDIIATLEDVCWFENLDGAGTFSEPQLIADFAEYICCIDLDLDEDLDIVTSDHFNGGIKYTLNQDGLGQFGPTHLISDLISTNDIVCGDFNGDLFPDILAVRYDSTNQITWYENDLSNDSFISHSIAADNLGCLYSVDIADLDGDTDFDFVVGSIQGGQVSSFINSDGFGNFEFQSVVAPYENVTEISLVDIDDDDDIDILLGSEDNQAIVWCENADGNGTFFSPEELLDIPSQPVEIIVTDPDSDDDHDILVACYGYYTSTLVWFENQAGSYTEEHHLINNTSGNNNIWADDINSDGLAEVVLTDPLSDEIISYQYDHYLKGFTDSQVVTNVPDNPRFVVSADINGDSFSDLVMNTDVDNRIIWSRDLDGNGNFEYPHTVGYLNGNLVALLCDDINNDGTMDVVCATEEDRSIIWFENYNGYGMFYPSQQVGLLQNVKWLESGDLDGDGDQDIIAASYDNRGAVWFENNGDGDFNSTVIELDPDRDDCSHLDVVDIDSDGDLDIITTSYRSDDGCVLYKNISGTGTFSLPIIINSGDWGTHIFGADVDGDSDIDLLYSEYFRMGWYESTDGTGENFHPREYFISDLESHYLIERVQIEDIENDGDEDVILVDSHGDIFWFENLSDNINPRPFDLLLPENGTTITTETVDLTWEDAVDPDGNILFYNIYVSENQQQLIQSPVDTSHSPQYTLDPEEDGVYYWTISVMDDDGNQTFAAQVNHFSYLSSGIDVNQRNLPDVFAVNNIYPNPFNPETVITLSIPETGKTKLSVFNILGQEVVVLQDGILKAGYHNFTFSGQDLAGGCYFVKAISTEGEIFTKKMVLLK